jgi:hypothetical protein
MCAGSELELTLSAKRLLGCRLIGAWLAHGAIPAASSLRSPVEEFLGVLLADGGSAGHDLDHDRQEVSSGDALLYC